MPVSANGQPPWYGMFAEFPSNCIVENKNSKRGISAQEEASQHILGNTKGQLISECLKFSKKTPQ